MTEEHKMIFDLCEMIKTISCCTPTLSSTLVEDKLQKIYEDANKIQERIVKL